MFIDRTNHQSVFAPQERHVIARFRASAETFHSDGANHSLKAASYKHSAPNGAKLDVSAFIAMSAL
jgi:hypothetical protein